MENSSYINISRRSMLKCMGAAVAAATVSGCGTSSSDSWPYDEYAVAQNETTYNNGTEIKFNTGPYNCGSRCLHKFHIKNGRVLRMTSDGDIPRDAPDTIERDECPGHTAGSPVQKRACVRGYSYIQHNYQPNRLKYPLYQASGIRGNLEGFKRVSWEWAAEKIADEVFKATQNRSKYGYIPMYSEYTSVVSSLLGENDPYNYKINRHGNQSTGSVECAILDTTGKSAMGNTKNDRFNSKFIIVWALDPSRTTYYQNDSLWIHTKIKETGGVDIVFISSTLNDSAAMTGTGFSVNRTSKPGGGAYAHTYKGETTAIAVPRWLGCRPTTDGALTVAMMYVLYKNNLYDKEFLKANTFGFFSNTSPDYSTVTNSNAYERVARIGGNIPLAFPDDVIGSDVVTGNYQQGDKYGADVEYKVPNGYSFMEYLDSLETTWAASAANAYDGVLEYAAALTGVKAQYIEALAFKYAEPYLSSSGAAMIDIGGGANRTYNGPEWVWLQICLTAMCGYTNKSGGSNGINMMSSIDGSILGAPGTPATTMSMAIDIYSNSFGINALNYLHIPLTGTDGRTLEQLVADVKFQTSGADGSGTGLDLTKSQHFQETGKPLAFEVLSDVYISGNNANTNANINKNLLGLTDPSVKFSYIVDNVMTPTAAYRDLVLPRATHFEAPNGYGTGIDNTAYFLTQNLCKPLYEARSIPEIMAHVITKIYHKFGIGDGVYTPAETGVTMDEVKASYEASELTDVWAAKYGQSYKPGWQDFEKNGKIDVISPKNNPLLGFVDVVKPGKLHNSTGLINFFSPFWYVRMGMDISSGKTRGAVADKAGGPSGDYYGPGWRTATAKYIPVPGGFEEMFDNKNPRTGMFTGYTSPQSGRNYKMIYMTNKSRNRAHTVFDSTAIIKDQFRQAAKMNPITAKERGISDGELVYVYNDRGCMKIPAELTNQILPGYVSIEHGAWYRKHPSEKVRIWYKNRLKTAADGFETIIVSVDIGGADNILTDDDYALDTPYCTQTLAAHGGYCEVSLTKPKFGNEELA